MHSFAHFLFLRVWNHLWDAKSMRVIEIFHHFWSHSRGWSTVKEPHGRHAVAGQEGAVVRVSTSVCIHHEGVYLLSYALAFTLSYMVRINVTITRSIASVVQDLSFTPPACTFNMVEIRFKTLTCLPSLLLSTLTFDTIVPPWNTPHCYQHMLLWLCVSFIPWMPMGCRACWRKLPLPCAGDSRDMNAFSVWAAARSEANRAQYNCSSFCMQCISIILSVSPCPSLFSPPLISVQALLSCLSLFMYFLPLRWQSCRYFFMWRFFFFFFLLFARHVSGRESQKSCLCQVFIHIFLSRLGGHVCCLDAFPQMTLFIEWTSVKVRKKPQSTRKKKNQHIERQKDTHHLWWLWLIKWSRNKLSIIHHKGYESFYWSIEHFSRASLDFKYYSLLFLNMGTNRTLVTPTWTLATTTRSLATPTRSFAWS